jgi:hypothetical protein
MSAKQSALSFRIEEAMKIALDQAAAEDCSWKGMELTR